MTKPQTKLRYEEKRVTEPLIRKHVEDAVSIRPRLLGGFDVQLLSGASVKITQNGFDFGKHRDRENRKGIDEVKLTREISGLMLLSQEMFGGITFSWKEGEEEDVALFFDLADALGINTGDQGLTRRYFGLHFKIKYYNPGWRVTLPNGESVRVVGNAIEEVNGGPEIFRAVLRLLDEVAKGKVVIRGNPELIIAGLGHAKQLGIKTAIPEYYPERLYGLIAVVLQIACVIPTFLWSESLLAIPVGFLLGYGVWMGAYQCFWKIIRDDARRRGQNLQSKFASVHGDNRTARFDDAKSRGLV